MTLIVLTIALLFRGARSDASFYLAAVALGIAMGVRSQNLTIVALPALVAMLRARRWSRAVVFICIVAAIVFINYGAAAHLSGGWTRYRDTLARHERYIAQTDSFRSPTRQPMWQLFDNFFMWPYRALPINLVITALVAISGFVTLVRRRAPMLVLLATFAPFCIGAWALLDHFSTSRFSIGYAPLFAFLAADGVDLLLSRWLLIEAISAAAISASMIVWTSPALHIIHATSSPSFQATEWIRRHVDPKTSWVYVDGPMQPMCDAFLTDMPLIHLGDDSPLTRAIRPGVYVREGKSDDPAAIMFTRARGRIEGLVRPGRFFEVSITPLHDFIRFTDGWYAEEGSGKTVWRWMGKRGEIALPPQSERMRISIQLYVPLDALAAQPNLTITFNGRVIDRIHATTSDLARSYDVAARLDARNDLVIETDRTIRPANDTRDLGVRLNDIEWTPR